MIDLLWLGASAPPAWPLGRALRVEPSPAAVDELVRSHLASSTARAWLFWDEALGPPEPDRVRRALRRPGDVWHCGLRLGLGGLPRVIDHVMPTWMFTRDGPPETESTNWRISLRACLVRVEVLRTLGGILP